MTCDLCAGGFLVEDRTLAVGTATIHLTLCAQCDCRLKSLLEVVTETARLGRAWGLLEECLWCGGLLPSRRTTARYCSAACRQAAYRKRRDTSVTPATSGPQRIRNEGVAR